MIGIALLQILLVLFRVAGFVSFFPVFSNQRLPRLVKLGLVLCLTSLWIGRAKLVAPGPMILMGLNDWVVFILLTVREAVFGAGLGFAFGLLIHPARMAGIYIGQEMGLSLASIADPASGVPTSVVGQLFEWTAILLLFVLDIHHVLLRALNISFQAFGIGQRAMLYPAMEFFRQVDISDRLSLLIAAPVAITLFLTIVVLALWMRAVPQMNIFSVGLALKTGVGLLAMLFFLPAILLIIARILVEGPALLQFVS